jgi:hypothetical protein
MALTNKQIAEHFGFTASRAAALIRQGMPVTSLEEAATWRDARLLRGQRGGVEQRTAIQVDPASINPDDGFEQTVERHRELKEAARQRYIIARDTGDDNEAKIYGTYQNILKTLVSVEREALARRIEAKELIKTSHALDKFSRILAEIKADLLSMPTEIAPEANAEEPQVALKVIDEKVQKLLAKWSALAVTAGEDVVGDGPKASAPDIDEFGKFENDPE